MAIYLIYRRRKIDGEVKEWVSAIIDGDTVVGETPEEAESVLRELKGEGWPAVSPERIFMGSRVWAAEISPERLAEMIA
jgi:hypothetical protein